MRVRVATALSRALRAAGHIQPGDAAAVALVRNYAELIDNAAPKAAYADALRYLRELVDLTDVAGDGDRYMRVIEKALAEHSVASDIGPKLLAGLSALGLTLAGRAGRGNAWRGGVPDEQPANPLDDLKRRREARQRSTG